MKHQTAILLDISSFLSYHKSMEEFNSADILRKQDRKKRLAFLEIGLFEISFVLIIIVVIFGSLNYFNILSLSTLYPNTFGFLPHKTASSSLNTPKINAPAATPVEVLLKEVPMADCPLETGCKNSVQIGQITDSDSKDFSGLGFTEISSQIEILAAIDGTIEVKNITENAQELTQVSIANKNLNLAVTYKFGNNSYAPALLSGEVKQKQKIGTLEKNSAVSYNTKTYSFIFYLQNLNANDYIRISSSQDGKTINNSE